MEGGKSVIPSVVSWQVISPDPDASSRFLGRLFGWTTSRDNQLGYREVRAGDQGIHGGIWPAPPTVTPFVQLFIEVADIDACLAQAVELGAKVLIPKSVLPEGGAMAVIHDPLGLPIALQSRSTTA